MDTYSLFILPVVMGPVDTFSAQYFKLYLGPQVPSAFIDKVSTLVNNL